jgi:hypothetical protein
MMRITVEIDGTEDAANAVVDVLEAVLGLIPEQSVIVREYAGRRRASDGE